MKAYLADLPSAETFLRDHLGPDVQHVQELGWGEWSVAFAYCRGGHEYVARFGLYDEDFHKDRLVGQYAATDLPLPCILEIGRYKQGFFAISERAYGQFLDQLDGEAMRATLSNLLETLDAVREVELSGSAGFGGWNAVGDAPYASWREALLDIANDRPEHRTYGWRASLEARPEHLALFNQVMVLFEPLLAFCPDERHLIHNDLLNRNVLVEHNRITALLDWGDGRYGDALYDLAHLLFWWPWFSRWRNIDLLGAIEQHYALKEVTMEHFNERLRCYQLHIGLESMAYHCYTGRGEHFTWSASRALEAAQAR